MKKTGNLLLCFLCLLVMTACGREESDNLNIYSVYYVSNSETKVEMHEYEMQSETAKDQVWELIQCLSTMPDKLEYKAPLAMGFQVLDVEINDGTIPLTLHSSLQPLPFTLLLSNTADLLRKSFP